MDEQIKLLVSEINDLRDSLLVSFRWGAGLIVTTLIVLLGYIHSVDVKIASHEIVGMQIGATLGARLDALEKDLRDKYNRHMKEHD